MLWWRPAVGACTKQDEQTDTLFCTTMPHACCKTVILWLCGGPGVLHPYSGWMCLSALLQDGCQAAVSLQAPAPPLCGSCNMLPLLTTVATVMQAAAVAPCENNTKQTAKAWWHIDSTCPTSPVPC